MYSLEIIAAFDFLPEEIVVGTLQYERVKGNPSYRFQYDKRFLESFPNVSLSADLGKFLGLQTSDSGISDSSATRFPTDGDETLLTSGKG